MAGAILHSEGNGQGKGRGEKDDNMLNKKRKVLKSKAKYHQSIHTFCTNSETEGISKPIHDPALRNRYLTVAMTPGVHAPWSPCAFSQRAIKAGTDSIGRASLGHCIDAGRKGEGN